MRPRSALPLPQVTSEFVIVQWGAVLNAGATPVAAAQAAMEMAKAVRPGLASEVQSAFHLRIGLGTGLCHITTLSAGGQRFFVMAGPEVSTPFHVVMGDVAGALRCEILMTKSVYDEVCV